MIFVVFLIPLGLYLLLLGHVNRQPRPVFLSGTLDFIGILFAASGFLLFGGPAVLTSLNESWRHFWLLGENNISREGLLAQWQFWVFLSLLYFGVVVASCGVVFRQRRRMTCIYNVEPAMLDSLIEDICQQYGLSPIRSGNVYVFGPGLEQPPPERPSHQGIQAPHAVPTLVQKTKPTRFDSPALSEEFAGQSAVLEIEPFESMRHVTLRWEPSDSPLRAVLETELERRLGTAGAPYHETGLWLTLAGYAVLSLALFTASLLMLRSMWLR